MTDAGSICSNTEAMSTTVSSTDLVQDLTGQVLFIKLTPLVSSGHSCSINGCVV